MKKMLAVLAALAFVCLSFSGAALAQNASVKKFSVVATNFPAYDFAWQVSGDRAEVTMLLPPGAESHTYEPTPQDILKIQNAGLFVYVGGESDAYVYRVGPGCCGNDGSMYGFEFTWNGEMPRDNDWIEVVGTLNKYDLDGQIYLTLKASSVTKMAERGAENVYR